MQQAIDLFTGGAQGAGDAQDPSRTIASERALNRGRAGTAIQRSDLMPVHFYFCDNSRGGAVEFPRSQLSRRAVGAGGLTGDTDSLDGSTRRHGKVTESPWV